MSQRAWLGLGGNIGDVRATLTAGLQQIDSDPECAVTAVSKLYKTPPWGVTEQAWFLNCCAEIETTLEPEALLELCQAVERAGNRKRTMRWGPRTIDVDILIYEGVEQTEQRLTIPHPRIAERAFVLVPLADIAPQAMLSGNKIADLADKADREGLEIVDERADWWRV
ncbi:2-amino-4-hydroxy-6-hydroxymethyldihydropteridine diphosphokinase [Pseudahrensia aquimaris]|uniref:2-amino-4-hydroxy-6-hydroxymethyldihydropteridine pyrophosphokinase n=1 Tax=Pseudahrensia aquimaris TaxID=744461 RepID=A0ABW3FLB4_9HYPH